MGRLIVWTFLSLTLCSLGQAADRVRYIVKVKSGNSANPFSRLALRASNLQAFASESRHGMLGVNSAQEYNGLGISVIEGRPEDVERSLKNHPLVEYYEKEVYWQVASDPMSSGKELSPWLSTQMGLSANSPSESVTVQTAGEVIVAVVDTGVMVEHPFLQSAISINTADSSINNVDNDGNGYKDDKFGASVIDGNGDVEDGASGHGTHVAGLIKAVRDQAYARGYTEARKVSILPVKFIDSSTGYGSTSGAIEALDYSLNRGAKVINASWGARGTQAFSRALYDALVELYKRDVVIAVAAGNAEGGVANNNDITPYFPSSYNIPALISVASLTPRFESVDDVEVADGFSFSTFSNYGTKTVDLAAVGSYRDSNGNEAGVYSANADYDDGDAETYFVRKRGTSMATPLVAGVAAVIRAINPDLSNYEVKKIIIDTATTASAFSKTKGGAALHGTRAFNKARTAVSKGLRPDVSSTEYYTYSSSKSSSSSGGGGCGTLQDIGGSSNNSDGPFGGNSLMLFTACYLLFQGVRKRNKQVYNQASRG